jgi:hypothetical protein
MAGRKNRESKTAPQVKDMEAGASADWAFPSKQERLPPQTMGTHQVATGTREEISAWLQKVPRNTGVILIHFSNEASYKRYGPLFWYVARELPKIVARVQRRRFEQLVDALA